MSTYQLIILCFLISGCAKHHNQCQSRLLYNTNPFTQGEVSLKKTSYYEIPLYVGENNDRVLALLDTTSSQLVINNKDMDIGLHTIVDKQHININNNDIKYAQDDFDVACIEDMQVKFLLTAKEADFDNSFGLAFMDMNNNDKNHVPFFKQITQQYNIFDAFSLSMCGIRNNSYIHFGGYKKEWASLLGNFIPIIEKTAYVVKALTLRRSDNKILLGKFPDYDKNDSSSKTIISSASSFLLLPRDMADHIAYEINKRAESLGLSHLFIEGYFNTQRSSSIKIAKFNSLLDIKQFPGLEISFQGVDDNIKNLEISPLNYFKAIDENNPLLRIFAIRESVDSIILGQPFLESYYTYFDLKNGRIGFMASEISCGQ